MYNRKSETELTEELMHKYFNHNFGYTRDDNDDPEWGHFRHMFMFKDVTIFITEFKEEDGEIIATIRKGKDALKKVRELTMVRLLDNIKQILDESPR